jgi:hypothetical protein
VVIRQFDPRLPPPGGNAYVALSRHKENVSIFVPQDQTKDLGDLGELAAQMARAKDKTAASQYHQDVSDLAQEKPQERSQARDAREERHAKIAKEGELEEQIALSENDSGGLIQRERSSVE